MIEMTLHGDSYARGREQGERYATLIAERIDRFQIATLLANDDVVNRLWAALEAAAPEVANEIRGIADGSGLDLRTIFAITAARELSHGGIGTDGCTNVCRLLDGDAIVAKNSDGDPRLERYVCVQRSIPEGGPSFIAASFVGGVGSSFGVNEAGLAFASASIPAPGPLTPGIPPISLSHLILSKATTVAEVIAIAGSVPVAGDGAQTIWVDSAGATVRLETLPGSVQFRIGEVRAGAAHANWPLIDASVPYANFAPEHVADSALRLENVEQASGHLREIGDVLALLRTHGRGGLCRHGDLEMYTVLSGIAYSTTRKILALSGPPCAQSFQEYHLES